MTEINVVSRTQHIIVDPASSSVSIINAGPAGPAGTSTLYGVPSGGTTGQVLTKRSNADYDFGWVTPSIPDFTVAVVPSSRSGAQSASTAAFAVTATPLNGFTGTITWSTTGLPSGATPTFAPPTGLSTSLTIALSAGCVPGSYPITIVGTSGTLVRSISATLVVTAAVIPDFTLAVVPSSQSAAQATSTAAFLMTATAVNGFAGTITWSTTGLPAGATPTFAPTTGLSTSLTIALSAGAVVGLYDFFIIGTSGALSHSIPATVIITAGITWPPAGSTMINVGDNWQTKVNAGAVNTVFAVAVGVHSGATCSPKNGQQFIGNPAGGSILDGATTQTIAFGGAGTGCVFQDLEVRYYKTPVQHGAIEGGPWTVTRCNIHHNFSAGVYLSSTSLMTGGQVHHNGQIGVKAWGNYTNGSTWDGVEIHNNHKDPGVPAWGWTSADPYFEIGGSKFIATTGLIVRNCWVHHNDGPALWTDINNYQTLYEGNTVEDNVASVGIFHEISYDAIIRNNIIRRNGTDSHTWLWNSGILIAASGGVGAGQIEIYGNTLTGNGEGIGLVQQNRTEANTLGPHIVQNVYVHDNHLFDTHGHGAVRDTGGNEIWDTRNNRFVHNDYHGSNNWNWKAGNISFAAWQAIPEDATGSNTP